jgi:protein-tyrosine phosphatase
VENFRDVGEFINLIAERAVLPERRLFRGGSIKALADPALIGNPRTIVCLQRGPDPEIAGIRNLHFPISNDYEKYETSVPEVRKWLRSIVRAIESGVEFPLYVHCLSGRDRTGVVIAALLKICELPDPLIIEEYRLSRGAEANNLIYKTLQGLGDLRSFFRGIDLAAVKKSLLNR